MDIRHVVVEAARRQKLDYKALAVRAGLPAPTVHRYLNEMMDLTGGRINQLLTALGLIVGEPKTTQRVWPKPKSMGMEPVNGKVIVRYPGSRWRLLDPLVRLMPPHRHFVSLFGGSGADILRKPPSPLETFNDLDGNVHNLFTILQDARWLKRLKEKLSVTPTTSQPQFRQAVEMLKGGPDPVDRAWAFLVVSFQGYGIKCPSANWASQWRHARKPHSTAKAWLTLPEALDEAADRFRSVQIMNEPWQKAIQWTDSPDTLFMVDPPFIFSPAEETYYAEVMSEQEHEELLRVLGAVKGFVMLLACDHPLYRQRLGGWRKVRFHQKTSLDPNGSRPVRSQVVWMNFDVKGKRLGYS